MATLRRFWKIWSENQLANLAAALAFFTSMSLAPMLVLLVEMVGLVPGLHHAAVRDRLLHTISQDAGPSVGSMMRDLVAATYAKSQRGVGESILAWATMLFAASGLFGTVQLGLEKIWQSQPAGGIKQMLRDRAISFALVGLLAIAAGFWIAAAPAAGSLVSSLPGGQAALGVAVQALLEWIVFSATVAVLFKVLPDAPVRWRSAFEGAAMTGAFVVAGQFVIGWYLHSSANGSAYGIAGAFIAMLLWIYYSAQLFLAGAALTRARSPELDGAVAQAKRRAERGIVQPRQTTPA